MSASKLYEPIKFETNMTYIVRLHWNSPKLRNGKYGEFYFTTIDVWLPNGVSDSAINKMVNGYSDGAPPQMKSWTVPESFIRMWIAIGLKKDSTFLLTQKTQRNPSLNKDFPYLEIRLFGKDKEVHSTLNYRQGDVGAELDRDSPNVDLTGVDAPKEHRLLYVNPDVYKLMDHAIGKAKDLCQQETTTPEVVTVARHLYFETQKRGWTEEWSSSAKSD